jgi:acetyl esterase/lipase
MGDETLSEIATPGSAGDLARRGWKQDPDRVKSNILQVALEVFAERGFSGARVDEIAARTETSKRMIYYYFGDKEGVYRAVLEYAYEQMRHAEDALDLAKVSPVEALRKLAEFTFDHHRSNNDFIRLVMIENIHEGRNMSQSPDMPWQNSTIIQHLEDIYQRGCESGLFRRGLTAVELHWHISALCYFNVSNRSTFSRIFGNELFTEQGQSMLRRHVGDMILRFVLRPEISIESGTQKPSADARNINPDLYRYLQVWDSKWAGLPQDATPPDRRLRYEAVAREMRMPVPDEVDTHEERWLDSDGGPVRVRIFRSKVGGHSQAALIYLHGGMWMQGSPETHWDVAARIAAWNLQTVISVDYALAPEHPYPAALNQCTEVVRWSRIEASELGIDPNRIAVGGESAGGNLAAATALKCRDEGISLAAQLLIYPICDFDSSRPSCVQNADGPPHRVSDWTRAAALYCPEEERLYTDPYVNPVVAASHRGLPPAFVAFAQYDPHRDSAVVYADMMEAAGVAVTRDAGEGLIHSYLQGMDYCADAETRLRRMAEWLKRTGG